MKTLALVLFGLVATALVKAEDYPASEKFAQTYPVSAQAELFLSNINGSVEIVAWDKNEIALEAEKRARNTDDLSKILINIDATPDHVTVKTEHSRTGWFGSEVKGSVHYTLHVPAGIALRKIESVNSNITIHDVHGEMIASTVNGSIHVTNVTTSAWLKTVNGNIEASIASSERARTIEAKTVNGSCKLALNSNIAANVYASTVNGHVNCSLPLTLMKTSRTKLEGRMGQGVEATIEVKTVNGNIAFNSE
jgi:DUF4097 and DUF4098 domain-containing protein YvlB